VSHIIVSKDIFEIRLFDHLWWNHRLAQHNGQDAHGPEEAIRDLPNRLRMQSDHQLLVFFRLTTREIRLLGLCEYTASQVPLDTRARFFGILLYFRCRNDAVLLG